MLRSQLLKRLAFYIVLVAVLNQIASFFDWYDLVWWFDMPMHFLGGVAVFYLSAVVWAPALKYVPAWRFIYESIITALLLGVLWEALELFLYIHLGTPRFILLDSCSDMFFDLAGACFAGFATVSLLRVYKDSHASV